MILNRRASEVYIFLILFSLLMSIGLISAFYKILTFESRAAKVADALKDAQEFKRDYAQAVNSPVDNFTICHRFKTEDCTAYGISTNEKIRFFTKIKISIPDPPLNITTHLLVPVVYDGVDTYYLNPEVNSGSCITDTWKEMGPTAERNAQVKICQFDCGSPVSIRKERYYNATLGRYVSRIYMGQYAGDGCS